MTDTRTDPINAALTLAPTPEPGADVTADTWIRHYAALALAAYATNRIECRNLPPNPQPGSRPDIGYLALLGSSATAAAAALMYTEDYAPEVIWGLTPEVGAFNGEWEEWLADVLVRRGINPADIDPDLDPADFTPAVAA